ncbi:Metallo peptidase M20 [Heterobasidion irregulare TC 32-1]|uniref:Metallo peptidase M20 n=1 Tax=Heterobasidion irregulare (strain TC 32-1) TaxID=747525 RepID=W4K0V6_HETIT|nr:Metallo peptidase M20 [Heterobasidion irregulare TC 32-1]ETW78965.1 Metallo peptidase M20 [Heterobasidion irregulare TC 32-1]
MPCTTAEEHSNLDTSRPQKRYLIDILSCFLSYLFRVAIPVLSLIIITLYLLSHLVIGAPSQGTNAAPHYPLPPNEDSAYCPQTGPIFPLHHAGIDNQLETLYARSQFQLRVFDILKGIIQVPTESYDDLLPVGQDPRWEVFDYLHTRLRTSFPLVYEKLAVTTVNTYALVYHWQGSEPSLKPILLTAHQDVVPVDPSTVDQWEKPPYSGYYDGTWVWGRGSVDDKADLVTQLITIDSLLKLKFVPTRTVILAFGIDEEASGLEGAGHLAVYLERKYGKDSFAMLVDEGGGYINQPGDNPILAFPEISEKGYLDARIEVKVPGGHSSVPPLHTGIGILSSIITLIEANPHAPSLPRTSTPFRSALCTATYGHAFSDHLRHVAFQAVKSDSALEKLRNDLLALDPVIKATLSTTQAVDLVWGGVKVNALPEGATAVVNHRIAEDSSVGALQKHLTDLITPLAHSFNLSVRAFGSPPSLVAKHAVGEVVLSNAWGRALEPSPISPTGESGPWRLLSGTIKATAESRVQGLGAAVIPNLATGNTDTRFYWNLTRHIFRYSHRSADGVYDGIHTINEAVRGADVIDEIRFFTKLILNADESLLLD